MFHSGAAYDEYDGNARYSVYELAAKHNLGGTARNFTRPMVMGRVLFFYGLFAALRLVSDFGREVSIP